MKLTGIKYKLLMVILYMTPMVSLSQEVRFLIDASGSMKKTDPKHLTVPALKLITHLLPEQNIAGIWEFSSTAKNIVPLSPVTNQWRQETKRQASKLKTDGRFTNIGKAIEEVSQDWFLTPPTQERILILLTDGKIDVSTSKAANLNAKEKVIKQLIPKLKKHKIAVYNIGLSNNVDKHLLEQLSFNTNGTFQVLKTPEQLQDSFYAVFNAAVNSNEVPIVNNEFKIDAFVTEVTLLLVKDTKKPFSLDMPNGESYPLEKAKIFSTSNYTFISIKEPLVGRWKIKGLTQNRKNRAIILSDLKLTTRRFNHNFFAGEKIITFAFLTNNGIRLTNEKIISNTQISITAGDSKKITLEKPTIHEINYRKDFYLPATLSGNINIKFQAKSKTFERIKSQTARIEPFPYEISFRRRNGFEMQVYVTTPNTKIIKSTIKGTLNYQTQTNELHFKKLGAHKYYAKYPIMCTNEHYTVNLSLSGLKISNERFVLKPLTYQLECRKKNILKSYTESIDTNQLEIKNSHRKGRQKKT